jgi:hypothetical protein
MIGNDAGSSSDSEDEFKIICRLLNNIPENELSLAALETRIVLSKLARLSPFRPYSYSSSFGLLLLSKTRYSLDRLLYTEHTLLPSKRRALIYIAAS